MTMHDLTDDQRILLRELVLVEGERRTAEHNEYMKMMKSLIEVLIPSDRQYVGGRL